MVKPQSLGQEKTQKLFASSNLRKCSTQAYLSNYGPFIITYNDLKHIKVKELKKYTGFVVFTKAACGKDFLAALQDGRVQ